MEPFAAERGMISVIAQDSETLIAAFTAAVKAVFRFTEVPAPGEL
jgi:hypothetical protein